MINLFLILVPILAIGQTEKTDSLPKRNTLFIEFWGQGLNSSFNYDRLYRLNKKVKTSLSIGVEFKLKSLGEGAHLGLPVSYNFLFGKKTITWN